MSLLTGKCRTFWTFWTAPVLWRFSVWPRCPAGRQSRQIHSARGLAHSKSLALSTSAVLLLGLLSSVSLAQTKAPAKVRRLSLQDCIKLTLEYNLDLKIDRYNPQISLFTYRATYGDYDPSFTLSGEHIHSESGSRILSGGFSIPGSVSDSDSFSSGLTGLLPWGTRYGLGTGTPIQNTYGTSGASVNDLSNPLFFTTNN